LSLSLLQVQSFAERNRTESSPKATCDWCLVYHNGSYEIWGFHNGTDEESSDFGRCGVSVAMYLPPTLRSNSKTSPFLLRLLKFLCDPPAKPTTLTSGTQHTPQTVDMFQHNESTTVASISENTI